MDSSEFARLSPEIRNQIYEYTFLSRFKLRLADGETQHALTKTCRQVRRETLEMYYSLTRFNAHLDDRPCFPLTSWLQAIGPERALLLQELHVWGMHDLSFSIHAKGFKPHELSRIQFSLSPVATDSLETMRYLKAVLAAYQDMGLTLLQYSEDIQVFDPENLDAEDWMTSVCSWFMVTRTSSDSMSRQAQRLGSPDGPDYILSEQESTSAAKSSR